MLQESALSGAVVGAAAPTSRMRILHVILQVGPTNSQWNEHCLPVADARDIAVCSLFPSTVDADPRITRFDGDGSLRGAMQALRDSLRAGHYDVVHVHAPPAAAMLVAACMLERRSIANVVMTLHTSWPNLRPRSKILAAAAFRALPAVVACSHASAESIPQPVRRLARRGVEVVANGVDVERVDRALGAVDGSADGEKTDRPVAGITVVTVGRLIPVKGQSTLLAAFARVARPGDSLLVVGEGPLAAQLEEQARALGVSEQVRLLGLIPRDDVYRLLAAADLFVSASEVEGLPLAVLEAMAARLPVVLTDIAPHREIVDTAGFADLVPLGDVAALATALRRLQDMSGDERAALGERGRHLVVDSFSLRSMSSGYDRTYSRLLTRSLPTARRSK